MEQLYCLLPPLEVINENSHDWQFLESEWGRKSSDRSQRIPRSPEAWNGVCRALLELPAGRQMRQEARGLIGSLSGHTRPLEQELDLEMNTSESIQQNNYPQSTQGKWYPHESRKNGVGIGVRGVHLNLIPISVSASCWL